MSRHDPVLMREVIEALAVKKDGIYVDATFGQGGYTNAILKSNEGCHVYGIDRDDVAIEASKKTQETFPGRFTMLKGCFGDVKTLLEEENISKVDGIAFDLGVSSPQLDDAHRGFSFSKEGPLDMRMGDSPLTAADIVNTYDEKDLADIIYTYGEETYSRRIARKIVEARKEKLFETTTELADVVRSAVPKKGKVDSATKTFQALRIYVNKELQELEKGLEATKSILKETGRLVVVTFHSLEDRIVKNFLKENIDGKGGVSRHLPDTSEKKDPLFKWVQKKALAPTQEEIDRNPRARSAKLRAAERTAAANTSIGESHV